jgi:nitrile hydratase accessory protein
MSDIPATVFDMAGQPCDEQGPVFREPWEAQAFAITVSLHQQGLFSWPEWTCALAAQIAAAQASGEAEDADLGGSYYRHWLAALETLVAAKGAASLQELSACQRAWQHAVERTPHGQPLTLEPSDC